jgi:ferritin-like protein
MAMYLPEGPEATVCLRKLLEAKDCAVRAALDVLPAS